MERLKSSLCHTILYSWNGLALRSIVLVVPLEAKPHSQTCSTGACGITDMWFQILPQPPTHLTWTFFWWNHKFTSSFYPSPPSSHPTSLCCLATPLHWRTKSASLFSCHSQQLSEGPCFWREKRTFGFSEHWYLWRSICTEAHHVWTEWDNTLALIGLQCAMLR